MDFTETPHAEDFAMELGELIEEYQSRGLSIENIKMIFDMCIEEYDLETEDD